MKAGIDGKRKYLSNVTRLSSEETPARRARMMAVVIRINITQAKNHLSKYLRRVEKNRATIILCRRNVPIAEICPLKPQLKVKRPLGLGKGEAYLPPSFFDPLPDDLLDAFEGKS